MTAPHEPHDPTAAELGSTAQFKAFVKQNDEPAEARERASADTDAPTAEADAVSAPSTTGPPSTAPPSPAPPASPQDAGPGADPDDREIQFSAPAHSGPPVQSLRPEVESPPAELGSTAQFRAFASGDGAADAQRDGAPREGAARSEAPAPPRPTTAHTAQPGPTAPALPPADPSGKRNLLVSLAVVVLVVVAVVLLFVLV